MTAAVRIGTRGSALAMAQARLAAESLAQAGAEVEMVTIQTAGDRRAADTPWGEGAFVGALEQALHAREVDVAVHSAKDMPTAEDPRLRTVAYLPRADARDALVLRVGDGRARLDDLPSGASIGTDSPRRTGFLRARRPDLAIRPLHGNVDTRLRRLDEGEVDALVLAAAGLDRLGRGDRISQRFEATELPPAPGQGAIAIQARADDERMADLGRQIDHSVTRIAVDTERAFLAATGGGCRAPVGALATVTPEGVSLLAGFATVDGGASAVDRQQAPLSDAAILAVRLAHDLVERRAALGGGQRVLVTRPEAQSARLAAHLSQHGLTAVMVPAIEVRELPDNAALIESLRRPDGYAWVVVTSANGARAAAAAARQAGIDVASLRWAAVGATTAAALRLPPGRTAWQPSVARSEVLGDELSMVEGNAILLIRGNLADQSLVARLRGRGAQVHEVVAYETVEAPPASAPLLKRALAGQLAAVVLASPSAVRGVLALAGDGDRRRRLLGLPAVCVGPVTAEAAAAAGFDKVIESPGANAAAVAETVAGLVASPASPAEVAS